MRIETNKTWTAADLRAALVGVDPGVVLIFGKTLKSEAKGECWCGCGGSTGGKFVPGHDSKFHSLAKQVARGQEDRPTDFVCDDAEVDFDKWHDAEVPVWEAKEALRVAKEATKPLKAKVTKTTKVATTTKVAKVAKVTEDWAELLAQVTMSK